MLNTPPSTTKLWHPVCALTYGFNLYIYATVYVSVLEIIISNHRNFIIPFNNGFEYYFDDMPRTHTLLKVYTLEVKSTHKCVVIIITQHQKCTIYLSF